MENLRCANSCVLGHSCGRQVYEGNESCVEQIEASLKDLGATLVVRSDVLVEAYALGSEGSVQVGTVVKGELNVNELLKVLPPAAV